MASGTDMMLNSLFKLLNVNPDDIKKKGQEFEDMARTLAANIDAIKNGIDEIQQQQAIIMMALDLKGATKDVNNGTPQN